MRYVKGDEAGKLPRTVWLIGHSGGVLAILLGDRLRQLGWQVAGFFGFLGTGRLAALPLPSLLSDLCIMLLVSRFRLPMIRRFPIP